MNLRKIVEEKILFIILTFDKELIANESSLSTFDIIRKHSLQWEDFSEPHHQAVYKAVQNQIQKGLQKIDFVNMMHYRPKEYKVFEQQANEFIALTVNIKNTQFASFSELETLIYKLKEFVMSDLWKSIGQQCLSANFQNMDVIKFGEEIVARYNNVYGRITSGASQVANSAEQMTSELRRKMELAAQGIIGGIPIHIRAIHNVLVGFNEPDLIVIGARPSQGKSITALSIAYECFLAGYPVAFASLEMNKQQLTNLIIASKTGIDAQDIRFGRLNMDQFHVVTQLYHEITNSDFIILENEFGWLEKLIAKARELHRRGKLKILFIDYLQLLKHKTPSKSRDEFIGEITKQLKALCLELNIPIVVLSQLKRASVGKKPTLEDLRESGNIEQDADVVGFIHREAFFQENYDTLPYEIQWLTEFIVRKNRSGAVDSVKYFIDIVNSKTRDV